MLDLFDVIKVSLDKILEKNSVVGDGVLVIQIVVFYKGDIQVDIYNVYDD